MKISNHYRHETCPCNVYPLEPHLYIAKLGYAGVYLFFLFLLQNIDCGYSLEPPLLTCTHNLCFEQKLEKCQKFSAEIFQFLKLKKSLFIAWASFRNVLNLNTLQNMPMQCTEIFKDVKTENFQ